MGEPSEVGRPASAEDVAQGGDADWFTVADRRQAILAIETKRAEQCQP